MKNFLFDIIHSLTKAEKRYFRLYTKGNVLAQNKNYLKLFDIILGQKENDEKQIKKELLAYSAKVNYNFAKSYLKSIVIECLVNMNAGTSVDSKLVQMISTVKMLRKKLFIRQSNSILKKAEKLAVQAEQFGHLHEIYTLQSRGLNTPADLSVLEKKVNLNKKADNLTAYFILSTKMTLYGSRKNISRNKSEIDMLKKLMDESGIMEKEEMALSLNAKIIFHHLKGIYYYFAGEFDSSLKSLYKRLRYQEILPFYIQDMPLSYKVCLTNIIAVNIMLKDYNEAEKSLSKLAEFPARHHVFMSEGMRIQMLYDQAVFKLIININTGRTTELARLLIKIEEELNSIKNKISEIEKIDIYYYISYGYFACKKFSRSLDWSDKLKNETDLSKREDIHSMIRILDIINHYELGHVELINYLERSARRFIGQKKRMFKTETVILKFFRKDLIESEGKVELIAAFKKLKLTLKKIFEDPFEAKVTEYFDFISWLESKIENRSFVEIVRKKLAHF